MTPEQLNTLMNDVTSQLDSSGCEYFLTVLSDDSEASIGSFCLNLSDLDGAARFISKAILQGGEAGIRLCSLFGKVMEQLPDYEQVLKASQAVEQARHRDLRP